jgi:large subunit ribosomal protein L4
MKVDVIDLSSNKISQIDLSEDVFATNIRSDIMARVVKWQLAKLRSGNHKVKTRAEVKHTTRKPYKQKGTGRARQGMLSVSQMRGGGVVFGPVVRDHSHKLPKKVRVLGLKSAISAKMKAGKLIVINNLSLEQGKTALLRQKLDDLGLKSALFVDNKENSINFAMACSNLIHIDVLPQIGLNVYDILKHDSLVCTEQSVKELTERLNG